MARREPELAQPPWVWGPSEVNAWINAVNPSQRRPATRRTRRKPRVRRLRVRVYEARVEDVQKEVVHGLAAIGFRATRDGGHRVSARAASRTAVASIHHSVLWRGLVVSVRFEPPLDRSASRHLLHRFAKRFRVVGVSSDDA